MGTDKRPRSEREGGIIGNIERIENIYIYLYTHIKYNNEFNFLDQIWKL